MNHQSNWKKSRMALGVALATAAVGGACLADTPPVNEGMGPARVKPNAWGAPVGAPATTMDPMDRGGGGAGGGGGGGGH
jgi:hypothetical protein